MTVERVWHREYGRLGADCVFARVIIVGLLVDDEASEAFFLEAADVRAKAARHRAKRSDTDLFVVQLI